MFLIKVFKKKFNQIESKLKKKRIVVISGGFSEERETSLESGKSVYCELKMNGFKVLKIDPKEKNIIKLVNSKEDIVFNCLHGSFGESGHVPAILDYLKVPYTFSDVYASTVTMDKIYFKAVTRKIGFLCPFDNYDVQFDKLKGSFIHKKIRGGSSLEMRLNNKKYESKKDFFVEQFIKGDILTIGILEHKGKYEPLGIVSLNIKNNKFYDEHVKFEGISEYEKYKGKNEKHIKELAVKISKFLSIKSGARIDMIEKSGQIYILELNSIPGMYPGSNLSFSAKLVGLSFYELLIWLLNSANYQNV